MGLWKASGRKGLGGRQGTLALLLGAVLLLCGCGTGASDGSAASGGGASSGSQAVSTEELAQHAYDLQVLIRGTFLEGLTLAIRN